MTRTRSDCVESVVAPLKGAREADSFVEARSMGEIAGEMTCSLPSLTPKARRGVSQKKGYTIFRGGKVASSGGGPCCWLITEVGRRRGPRRSGDLLR